MDQATPDPTSGVLTLDLSKDFAFEVNLNRNVTGVTLLGYENLPGFALRLILVQDATGGRTVTWPSTLKLAGGAITLTTTAGKRDSISFRRLLTSAVFVEETRSLNA